MSDDVKRIREAILGDLYKLWMENTQLKRIFGGGEPAEDWEPETPVALRECKQMEWYGWVEIHDQTAAGDRAAVSLTPCGRDVWEAFVKEKERNPSAALVSPTV